MPKPKRIGRKFFIEKAKEHAATQKDPGIAYNSFLAGVNLVLEELDGKTLVKDRGSNGDFVNAGTITGSFDYAMRGVEYAKEAEK